MKRFVFFVSILFFTVSCDTDHKSEFYRIQRDDIQGYEQFIQKYPSSSFVKDAKERIETAKEEIRLREERERREAEARRLENTYGNNSLSNGSAPYSRWYGNNQYYDDYKDSEGFEDEDDAWDDFEDNEDAWDDY